MADMNETAITADRDQQSGRFVTGCKPGPGRAKGSRNRLAENFLEDLKTAWEEHGADALRRCALEEPSTFCKIVAGLLPRDIDLNISVDVNEFASKFRSAREMLGNVEPPRLRRPLRVIGHAG
jgi:hypothetical protein